MMARMVFDDDDDDAAANIQHQHWDISALPTV